MGPAMSVATDEREPLLNPGTLVSDPMPMEISFMLPDPVMRYERVSADQVLVAVGSETLIKPTDLIVAPLPTFSPKLTVPKSRHPRRIVMRESVRRTRVWRAWRAWRTLQELRRERV